jgi:arabinan endo-1,5-alpha-L-arabinosidase
VSCKSREVRDFNTIDPPVFFDDDRALWLAFGSYWSGIKLAQLDPKTGKRLSPDAPFLSLAYNKSIEASCLYKHDGYYCVFVNWGLALPRCEQHLLHSRWTKP